MLLFSSILWGVQNTPSGQVVIAAVVGRVVSVFCISFFYPTPPPACLVSFTPTGRRSAITAVRSLVRSSVTGWSPLASGKSTTRKNICQIGVNFLIRTGPFLEKARTRVPSLGTRQLKNPWSTARAITLKRSEKTPQTLYAK